MKYLIVLLLGSVCIHSASCIGEPWKRDFVTVKYSPLGFNGFYPVPMSTDSKLITDEGYDKVDDGAAQMSVRGSLYCRNNDPRVCVIFDKAGTVVGIRISFLEQDVKDVEGYDIEAVNSYKKTNMFNQKAYSFDIYFFNPNSIGENGVGNKSEVADGAYAYINGELVSLPKEDPKIENYNGFQREACIPQMGQHYYWNTNKTSDCTKQVSFFGMYHNGEIVGCGIATYGVKSKAENGRDWYETLPLIGAMLITPNRPKCGDELIAKNGLHALHTYFVKRPYLIGCLFQ